MKFSRSEAQLISFLQEELAIPTSSITLAIRRSEPAPLPMILWQYGLVSKQQLEQILYWLDRNQTGFSF